MNFIQFTGHKKTSEKLLNNIKGVSKTKKSLLENLYSLDIFSSCTPVKNKISLDESPNSVKMRMAYKGENSLVASFPNIFGGGESIKMNFCGIKSFCIDIGRPVFISNKILRTKLSISRETKEINHKEIDIKKIELATARGNLSLKSGLERMQKFDVLYTRAITSIFGFNIDSKFGVTKTNETTPFSKVIIGKKFGVWGENTFLEIGLKLGKIFGPTSIIEKFFLGDTIRGYKKQSIGPVSQNKKVGGNSFIEMRSKAGVYIKKIEAFTFLDIGVNSIKGVKECGEILCRFGDNNCIGKSIGVGVAMKNKKGPAFIFAMPLTTNLDAEKYVFGADFEF
ncbi:hypothetical protein GINT2_000652 [Glugoides intestinalis]